MSEHKIRCGDGVFHRPSGETWVVAFADYESGDLAWLGWPPSGRAKISDCDLVELADDAKHAATLALLKPDDPRYATAQRLYGPDKAVRDEG